MSRYMLGVICLISWASWAQHKEDPKNVIQKADSLDDAGLYTEALQQISLLKKKWPEFSICEYGVIQGNLYNRTYNYDSALYSYRSVINTCKDSLKSVYSAMHGIAYTFRMNGNLDSSAVWEYKALATARNLNDPKSVNLSLQSLAILSYSRQEYRISIQQAMQVIKDLNEKDDLSLMGNMYNLVGENLRKLGKLDSARIFLEHALELRKKSGNESRIASSLNNVATIYLELRQGDEAMPYLLEALDIKKKYKDSVSMVTLYTNIGTAYFYEKKWKEARSHFEKSEEIGALIDYTDGRLTNFPSLIQLDTTLGNYKQAFSTLTKYHQLSNDYLNEAKQKELLELDKKYETEKKEQEIGFKDEQILARERSIVIISAATAGVVVLSIYLFILFRKNKKLSSRNELLLREQNHRVKNNLQMISSLLSLQSQKLLSPDAKDALEESQGRINSVALLHRMLYEGKNVGEVEVTGYIQTLVEEIQYSAGRQVKIDLKLPEKLALPIEKVTSLGLIVNELFTNSSKHVSKDISLNIQLSLSLHNDRLHLTFSDNGSGVAPEIWMAAESFGNKLIQLQSRQLHGDFEVSIEEGFKYELKIPA